MCSNMYTHRGFSQLAPKIKESLVSSSITLILVLRPLLAVADGVFFMKICAESSCSVRPHTPKHSKH